MRIEVYEKYETYDQSEPDWDRMGVTRPRSQPKYSYRRTYLDAGIIDRPIEIPGNKKEFVLRLFSGDDIIVKGDYDQFCIQLDDIEERMMIEDELLEQEVINQMK